MPTRLEDALSELSHLAVNLESELAGIEGELEIRTVQARRRREIDRIASMMRELDPADRKRLGQALNQRKSELEEAVSRRLGELRAALRKADLMRRVDVTLPGRPEPLGTLHPLTQTRREVERIFLQLGFEIATGPEVETEFHNFEALAIPREHPARDLQDTFFLTDDLLLRTHTSPVQIRTMIARKPPLRILCPGFVYRRDDDPTHSPMFMQFEGLLVDKDVSFAHLKGVLLHFVRSYFGEQVGLRLRASFFPFTEPSAEIDIECVFCGGQGCRTCKSSGYLEIGGCGMVDPEVFRHVGYDALGVTGFAFGMGIDRMTMLRHGIPDIKLLYENDVRFLRQFRW